MENLNANNVKITMSEDGAQLTYVELKEIKLEKEEAHAVSTDYMLATIETGLYSWQKLEEMFNVSSFSLRRRFGMYVTELMMQPGNKYNDLYQHLADGWDGKFKLSYAADYIVAREFPVVKFYPSDELKDMIGCNLAYLSMITTRPYTVDGILNEYKNDTLYDNLAYDISTVDMVYQCVKRYILNMYRTTQSFKPATIELVLPKNSTFKIFMKSGYCSQGKLLEAYIQDPQLTVLSDIKGIGPITMRKIKRAITTAILEGYKQS